MAPVGIGWRLPLRSRLVREQLMPRAMALRRAIPLAGARFIILSKYPPDANSIEQVFAKLKHLRFEAAHVKCMLWFESWLLSQLLIY
jgi:transposase